MAIQKPADYESSFYPEFLQHHAEMRKDHKYFNKKIEQLDKNLHLRWTVVVIVIGALIVLTGVGVGAASLMHAINMGKLAAIGVIVGCCVLGGIVIGGAIRRIYVIETERTQKLTLIWHDKSKYQNSLHFLQNLKYFSLTHNEFNSQMGVDECAVGISNNGGAACVLMKKAQNKEAPQLFCSEWVTEKSAEALKDYLILEGFKERKLG
jgi:hypothetical protein